MRSPLPPQSRIILSPKSSPMGKDYQLRDIDDMSAISLSNSTIPEPRASLSSFAAPSWNNGATNGEHSSNIRVVVRIRPVTKSNEKEKELIKVVSTIVDNGDVAGDSNTTSKISSSPTFKSPPPGSSIGEGVADIAARFNTNIKSPPIASTSTSISEHSSSGYITTPTKFMRNNNAISNTSPLPSSRIPTIQDSTAKTPLHTNVDYKKQNYKNNIISSSSLRQSFIPAPNSPSVSVTKRSKQQTISVGLTEPTLFDFDSVLDSSSSQEDVYNQSIGDAVRLNIFRGFNTTVIAYGQSNSGKSHSMYGNAKVENDHQSKSPKNLISPKSFNNGDSDNNSEVFIKKEDGIALRAINDLFMAKKRHATGGEVVINMTFIEIFNDRILDLLGFKKSFNSSASTTSGKGLTSIRLQSPFHARQVIQNAFKRKYKERSHTVCTLHVTINPAMNRTITSGKLSSITCTDIVSAKLTLVDLAGSERMTQYQVGNSGEKRSQASIINKDLFVLSQCITALAEKSDKGVKSHIPYRDSKLTSILRGSLGGNCCTVMVACISSVEKDLEDSLNTLRYAERTRNITNRVKKNLTKSTSLTPEEAAALRRENKLLRSQLIDLTKKYQFLRRGRLIVDFDSDCSGVENDDSSHQNILFSPSRSILTKQSESESLEAQRWRMKFEKLEKICIVAGIPTKGATLDENDEALLLSHRVEVRELKEQIQQLMCGTYDDAASIASMMTGTSALTMETYDMTEDLSVASAASGSSMISSLASRSLKSDYIGRTKLMEIEDKKLEARIQEKKSQLRNMDRENILRVSAMKLKLEKEESSHDQKINDLKEIEQDLEKNIAKLNDEIVELEDEKSKLKVEVNVIQLDLKENKETHLKDLKDHEDEIKNLMDKKSQIEKEIECLKSELKLLNQKKSDLLDEVKHLKNNSDSVVEYVQEQSERETCKGSEVTITEETKEHEEGTLMDRENMIEQLKEKVDEYENIHRNRNCTPTKSSILQERTNNHNRVLPSSLSKPPLPSTIQKKQFYALSPARSVDESVSSAICVSQLADLYEMDDGNNDDNDDNSSMLFGNNLDEPVDLDQSICSYASEASTMDQDQMAIRTHAQKILFWANKSIARNTTRSSSMNESFTTDVNASFESLSIHNDSDSNNKENYGANYHRGRPLHQSNEKMDKSSRVQSRSRSIPRSSYSPSPFIIRHKKGCTCHTSIFSANAEHTEFFLPQLGLACNCGAVEEYQNSVNKKNNQNNPTAVSTFLRPWQVSFLQSIGITSAKSLVYHNKHSAKDLAKGMKAWRQVKQLKPARTKSCLVALEIWSKVAKSVLKSYEKKKREVDAAFDVSNIPVFMEDITNKSCKTDEMRRQKKKVNDFIFDDNFNEHDDNNQSFASISTVANNMSLNISMNNNSFTLMEGEFEI